MQCNDIPTKPIIDFLTKLDGKSATWFTKENGDLYPNSIQNAMPKGIPPKLVLAKMKQLIHNKKIIGCACGCRGDFQIK